ncbi:MAG: hypothetical protein LUC43_03905 [Burkholderiales bacterium]|nr:hypothetical protein [Burkholderiales bacterium]
MNISSDFLIILVIVIVALCLLFYIVKLNRKKGKEQIVQQSHQTEAPKPSSAQEKGEKAKEESTNVICNSEKVLSEIEKAGGLDEFLDHENSWLEKDHLIDRAKEVNERLLLILSDHYIDTGTLPPFRFKELFPQPDRIILGVGEHFVFGLPAVQIVKGTIRRNGEFNPTGEENKTVYVTNKALHIWGGPLLLLNHLTTLKFDKDHNMVFLKMKENSTAYGIVGDPKKLEHLYKALTAKWPSTPDSK